MTYSMGYFIGMLYKTRPHQKADILLFADEKIGKMGETFPALEASKLKITSRKKNLDLPHVDNLASTHD